MKWVTVLFHEEREENRPREKLTSYHDGIKTGRGMMKRGAQHTSLLNFTSRVFNFGEKCLSIPRFYLANVLGMTEPHDQQS
jgi:hypothetical protein